MQIPLSKSIYKNLSKLTKLKLILPVEKMFINNFF